MRSSRPPTATRHRERGRLNRYCSWVAQLVRSYMTGGAREVYMSSTEGVDPEVEADEYEVAVVGGGPAGLSAALYTTRLSHDTVVIDRGGGRAAMMLDTHNVIGVPEEISGNEFLQTATEQVESYGGDVIRDLVTDITRDDDGRFHL